jgi:hypothetical protein
MGGQTAALLRNWINRSLTPEMKMKARNRHRVLNLIFYLLLAYQFVILILGNVQYKSLGHVQDGFCLLSFLLIYFYIFMSYAKKACIAWYEFWIRLLAGKFYTYDSERMYYRRKCIMLIIVFIASGFSLLSTIANIILNNSVLYQSSFGFIGISALVILILSITFGLVVIIQQIKKHSTSEDKGYFLFKTLILQNLLIGMAIFNMLLNAQI